MLTRSPISTKVCVSVAITFAGAVFAGSATCIWFTNDWTERCLRDHLRYARVMFHKHGDVKADQATGSALIDYTKTDFSQEEK